MEVAKTKIFEVLPLMMMVIMEGCTVGLTIFAKTCITRGMSPFVFIVYANSLATVILFLCSLLFHSKDHRSLSLSLPACHAVLICKGGFGFSVATDLSSLSCLQKGPATFYFTFVYKVLVPWFSRVLSLSLSHTHTHTHKAFFRDRG